jgi:hypothetical protein
MNVGAVRKIVRTCLSFFFLSGRSLFANRAALQKPQLAQRSQMHLPSVISIGLTAHLTIPVVELFGDKAVFTITSLGSK